MTFLVRYGANVLATFPVDPSELHSRGNAHERATDYADRFNVTLLVAGKPLGATVARVDDDGRERACSTFSKSDVYAETAALELSREARNNIARKHARAGGT